MFSKEVITRPTARREVLAPIVDQRTWWRAGRRRPPGRRRPAGRGSDRGSTPCRSTVGLRSGLDQGHAKPNSLWRPALPTARWPWRPSRSPQERAGGRARPCLTRPTDRIDSRRRTIQAAALAIWRPRPAASGPLVGQQRTWRIVHVTKSPATGGQSGLRAAWPLLAAALDDRPWRAAARPRHSGASVANWRA